MSQGINVPKVFLSYSWSSPQHEQWVMDLAAKLRNDGVDAIIDKWHLKPGQDKFAVMEKMMMSEEIHKVLVVCDRKYKEKADSRSGGVGVETQVITRNVYNHVNQEKFIPGYSRTWRKWGAMHSVVYGIPYVC